MPAEPGTVGNRIAIHEGEAPIVRRIFTESRDGRSLTTIAHGLNRDGIPSPRVGSKHKCFGWGSSTIRAILYNERYAGVWRFKEKQWVKIPGTNRRQPRARNASEVMVQERPDLRIIDQKLWDAVQARLALLKQKYAGGRQKGGLTFKRAPYLLSGILVCAACGAPMSMNGGSNGRYYRCQTNKTKGTCDNGFNVREENARTKILAAIRDHLLSPEGIAHTRKRVAEELRDYSNKIAAELRDRRGRLARTEDKMRGLVDFIATGDRSEYVVSTLRDLDPKLPVGILELHTVEGGTRGPILLVRVRKSFAAPHMVRAEGRFRSAFYVRDGARNRQLDTRGVREAVYASGDWADRFRAWRRDRIAAVLSAEMPIKLEGTRRLIVHIAPTSSLEGETSVDVRDAQRRAVAKMVAPFGSLIDYATYTFNVDGFVIHSRSRVQDYLQIFRSGLVESVDAIHLDSGDELGTRTIENELFKFVPMCAAYLLELGVLPPLVVALTLTGVQGMHHSEQPRIDRARKEIPTIDRDVVALPELLLDAEQLATDPRAYLAPIVNGLWQAGGLPGCPRYKDDGTYDGTRSYS